MAVILFVCPRTDSAGLGRGEINTLGRLITPTAVRPRTARHHILKGTDFVEFFPSMTRIEGDTVYFGLPESAPLSHTARDGHPDGASLRLRIEDCSVTVTADLLASRTLWYVLTEEQLIASTSQRLIVALLGDFEPEPMAASWMLCSGTLEPMRSWDRRMCSLPPGGRLTLNRGAWTMQVDREPCEFDPAPDPHERIDRLRGALEGVMDWLPVSPHHPIGLSGGIDSRALLHLLLRRRPAEAANVLCFTSTTAQALRQPGADPHVAKRVCERLGVTHEIYEREFGTPTYERFAECVRAFEGRIDNISGLDVLETLYQRGIEASYVGDEVFGWRTVTDALDARQSTKLFIRDDFRDGPVKDSFPTTLPEQLQHRKSESIETWRDRLYHEFRTPFLIGVYSAARAPYVESFRPFLHDSVVAAIRSLADDERTDKRAFRRIVETWGTNPELPYAWTNYMQSQDRKYRESFVHRGIVHEVIKNGLGRGILPDELLRYVLAGGRPAGLGKRGLWWTIKPLAERYVSINRLKKLARIYQKMRADKLRLNYTSVAIRTAVVLTMHDTLSEDAHALRRPHS